MQFVSTTSSFSIPSLRSNSSIKTTSDTSIADQYVSRLRRYERSIAPLTHEEVQQRMESTHQFAVTLQQRPTITLYRRRPTTVLLKGHNNEEAP